MVYLSSKSGSSCLLVLTLVNYVPLVLCISSATQSPRQLDDLKSPPQSSRLQRIRRSSLSHPPLSYNHTPTLLPRQQFGNGDPLNPFALLTSTFEDDLTETIASTIPHTQHTSTIAMSTTSTRTGTTASSSITSSSLTVSTTAGTTAGVSISTTASIPASATTSVPSPTTSPVEIYANSDPGPDSWKIIGIGVLAFTGVAVIILSVTFFDTWWATFLRPMLFGKSKSNEVKEQLIPDWERRSWRIGVEEKDDRYPSMKSLASIVNGNAGDGKLLYRGGGAVVMPEHRTKDDEDDIDSEKSPCVDSKDRGTNMNFPMPPSATVTKAPFPLYRRPSTGGKLSAPVRTPTTATALTAPTTAVPSPSPTLGRNNSLKTPERAYVRSPELPVGGRTQVMKNGNASPGPKTLKLSASAPVVPGRKASLKKQASGDEAGKVYGQSVEDYY